MQEKEKLAGDAAGVASPPARRRNRATRPWREAIGEFPASGLTGEYSEPGVSEQRGQTCGVQGSGAWALIFPVGP